mgnify:CR=1 FL=1
MKRLAVLFVLGAACAWAGEEVELKGELGCGHCDYHKAQSCAAGLKTADGKIYLIDNATKEIMDARVKGAKATVTGKVTEKEGLLYVHATKQEITK